MVKGMTSGVRPPGLEASLHSTITHETWSKALNLTAPPLPQGGSQQCCDRFCVKIQ